MNRPWAAWVARAGLTAGKTANQGGGGSLRLSRRPDQFDACSSTVERLARTSGYGFKSRHASSNAPIGHRTARARGGSPASEAPTPRPALPGGFLFSRFGGACCVRRTGSRRVATITPPSRAGDAGMARFDRMTPQGPAGFAGNIAPAAMRTGGGAPVHPINANPALGQNPVMPPMLGGGLPPTRQPVPIGHVGPVNAVGMGAQPGAYGVPPWFASMYGARR